MCVLCGQDFVAQVHWTDRHVEDRARAAEPGSDPVELPGRPAPRPRPTGSS